MNNDKFINVYIDILQKTLNDWLLQNVSLQANAKVSEDVINEQAENIQILNGRYGPYIKSGKDNVPIPKDKTWDSLTYVDVETLVKGFVKKPKATGFKKKK